MIHGIISARENAKNRKKACTWSENMYKYKSGQMSITDFGQPMGMDLNENNRWVKKAATIPWEEIEKRYAVC